MFSLKKNSAERKVSEPSINRRSFQDERDLIELFAETIKINGKITAHSPSLFAKLRKLDNISI